MQRPIRPEGLDTTMGTLRSPSISSDVMSSSAKSLNGSLPLANPSPAYIAANGASNLLSSEMDRTVTVSPQALNLVNEFLDHVLYNILTTARSVSLQSLRAAVPSVLKPRLGKAAVRVAEEDLKEYLEDEEDAEVATKGALDPRHAFDTELAWKLARLRCMVYAQLGDLEEEEEEEWLETEQLLEQVETRKDTHNDIQLGPAAAIFLASVIEYLGEQALYYAAQHAQKRITLARAQEVANRENATRSLTPKTDEVVLEGRDMNHVGRDSPLSRLWRSWRRNTRDTSSRQMSPEIMSAAGMYTPSHSRTGSQAPGIHQIAEEQRPQALPKRSPSQIPLPMGDNDIEEIEVPGLAEVVSDTEDDVVEPLDEGRKRPVSMTFMPGAFPGALPIEVEDEAELPPIDPTTSRPLLQRQRSMSSPAPVKQHFSLWKPHLRALDVENLPADSTAAADLEGREASADAVKVVEGSDVESGAEEKAGSPVSPNQSPQTPQSASVAARRGRISPQEPGSPNKRDGIVGGPLEVAIGAAGAAGAVALREDKQRKKSLSEVDTSTPPGPKRTVAEEMLGTQNVAPPKDAQTAASITNVADFDSMYVPMQMPSKKAQRAPPVEGAQPSRPKHKTSASQSSISKQLLQRKPLPAEPVQQKEPEIPVPVLSPSIVIEQGQAHRQFKERAAAANHTPRDDNIVTSVLTVQPQHHDSPVSPLPAMDQRPPTSGSVVSAEVVIDTPATPPDALRSHPPTHMHAESQHSFYSQRSKSSSSSSRGANQAYEPAGQTPPVPYSTAESTDEGPYTVYSPTNSRVTRDNRPSTASSSTSKLVGKAPTPVNNAVHAVQRSEDFDANKKKSLEILIRSNETLHYTLTPANVMQSPQSPKRTETQDMADFFRNTGPPGPENSRPTIVTTNIESMPARNTAVRSPVGGRIISSSQEYPRYSSPTGRGRNPLGEARDPRAERSTNMRELADYARSTGPLSESQLPQSLAPRAQGQGSVRNAIANTPRQPATTKPKSHAKLEARDPRPSRTADNSDLIDFIREGPPRAPGDHRIDRRVAPFRTTMDSEDLNSLAPNLERDSSAAYSATSTYDERSADPSINSQTALLTSNRRPPNGVNYSHASRTQPVRQMEDDGMPQRTRRRVKDPYAIYDSDDDEFGGDTQQTSNEESLIDFLRNTAPPPGSAPQPILAAVPAKSKSANAGYQSTDNAARRPYAGRSDRVVSKQNYEAREARPRRNDTSDLADYLRNSGPPPSSGNEPQPFRTAQTQGYQQQQKDDTGLMRMFTKRKVK